MLGVGFPPLSAEDVRRVTVSFLLLAGDESPRVFHHLNAHLHALLPDAKTEVIAGASHMVHEDAPVAFEKAVLTFLDGVA